MNDLNTLSNMELLAMVLGPREAIRLYRGTLSPLFASGTEKEQSTKCLHAVRELIRRWLMEEMQERDMLESPAKVRDFLILHFAGQAHESFVVLFLDAQNRLIALEDLFRGTLTQTSVYPREVVKRSLQVNAASVILAHNHPSGVAEPSRADELLTSTLKQALALVEVRVLDHIIIAGAASVSLAERGVV
ncbi:MAG: DNA repair protein RadC [Candidatus Accumulibacter sp. UW25]|jgi:DNA repair protein RadC